jgi:hypothetical protein
MAFPSDFRIETLHLSLLATCPVNHVLDIVTLVIFDEGHKSWECWLWNCIAVQSGRSSQESRREVPMPVACSAYDYTLKTEAVRLFETSVKCQITWRHILHSHRFHNLETHSSGCSYLQHPVFFSLCERSSSHPNKMAGEVICLLWFGWLTQTQLLYRSILSVPQYRGHTVPKVLLCSAAYCLDARGISQTEARCLLASGKMGSEQCKHRPLQSLHWRVLCSCEHDSEHSGFMSGGGLLELSSQEGLGSMKLFTSARAQC